MNKILLNITLIITIIIFVHCESTNTEPEKQNKNYRAELKRVLPLNDGDNLSYYIDTLDTQSLSYLPSGTKSITVAKTIENDEQEVYELTQNLIFNDTIITSKTSIIYTENTIEITVDTSGFDLFVSDSIEFDLKVTFDETAVLVKFPLNEGSEWDVFNSVGKILNFESKVFFVTGRYVGKDNVFVTELDSAIEADKFSYDGVLSLPNFNNIFVSTLSEYSTDIWMSEDYGIVKMEGHKLFINAINGLGISLSDSNNIVRHILTE